MKPALEKFLLIAATLAAIGLFIFVAMWSSIKDKKTQMDDLFNNTNVPSSFIYAPALAHGGIREDIHRSLYADSEHRTNKPSLHPAFAIPTDSIPA